MQKLRLELKEEAHLVLGVCFAEPYGLLCVLLTQLWTQFNTLLLGLVQDQGK